MKKRAPIVALGLLFLALIGSEKTFAQTWQQQVDSDIRVTLDDTRHELHGDITMTYQNNSPVSLESIWIHLWPNAYRNGKTALAKQQFRQGDMFMFYALSRDLGGIDSLAFHSTGRPLEWSHHPDHIDIAQVQLPAPLGPGESIEISTPFRVDLPSGQISRLGHIDQSYQITQWYPKPAVFDGDGWHPMPYLNQGEFYSEYGTFDVRITLPENYTVGATGDFVPGSADNNKEAHRLDSLVKATEQWVIDEGWSEATEDFPPSAEGMKTLHYRQSRVHDFAWFADKRYKVLRGEVLLPNEDRAVTTWSMFTPKEGDLWQKAPEYLKDATYYYSLWNGDYPYNQVTAVDGTISAGGGMEYPNVTVIGNMGSDSGLETVIVHEVGHNWFYGILGSNERDNAWMDEGINSFNETRYILTKYGDDKGLNFLVGNSNLAKRFDVDDFRYKWIDELSYLFPARFGVDQPIQCHSNDLTSLNYGAIVYKKTAATFAMLQSHLGTERFDSAMQLYFDRWKFRHPSPSDLQACLEESTGEDLSWFFEGWIQTTERNDLKLVAASEKRGIVVKNVGSLHSSAYVSAMLGDSTLSTVRVPLLAPGERTVLDAPNSTGADRWVLDPSRSILDYDRSNNQRRASGILRALEPLQLRSLTRLEDGSATQLFWLPATGWNAHDGMMWGVTLHNLALPPRDLTFQWTPLFSSRDAEKGLNFNGLLSVDWRKHQWHVGLRSTQFQAQESIQLRPDTAVQSTALTRTSWMVERVLNSPSNSPWKGRVKLEGVHLYGYNDPAPDAKYTLVPNSGGVRLQRRASRLTMESEHQPTSLPGFSQTHSLILGQVTTHGFALDTSDALVVPPHVVANGVLVTHRFVDAWWHMEYARPRNGRSHLWQMDLRSAWVRSSSNRDDWASSRNLDTPDFGVAVAGYGAKFDPLADELLLNRGANGREGWTTRQASLDRGGLPLPMVAPRGLWSARMAYTHPKELQAFVGVTVAWHDGVDELGETALDVTRNAVAGLGLPLGPLAIEVPLWVADGLSEDQKPWSLWMFKLDLLSLNPLKLVRQSLQ